MSHATVMVIGENPEVQLAPFDEKLHVIYHDTTKEYKKEYKTATCPEFFCSSNSSWGYQITKELFDFIKSHKAGAITTYILKEQPMAYLTAGKKYRGYYCLEGNQHKRCEGDAWFEVEEIIQTTHPDNNICFKGTVQIRVIAAPKTIPLKDKYPDYNDYLNHWHRVDNPLQQGYWTNPNSKWDWYTLGGRWSGMIKLKKGKMGKQGNAGVFDNQVGIDQAKKGDIANFKELIPFAVLKDGKWYERGQFVVSKEKDEWNIEVRKLVQNLPNDTLISIYDYHI